MYRLLLLQGQCANLCTALGLSVRDRNVLVSKLYEVPSLDALGIVDCARFVEFLKRAIERRQRARSRTVP